VTEKERVDVVEVGRAIKLEADRIYLWHLRGKPIEEARMIREFMRKHGLTQKEVAKVLPYSQAQISRLLSEGRMAHSTGFELAKLPREYRERLRGKEKITLSEVEELRRSYMISEELLDLVEEPLEVEESPLSEIEEWWRNLPEEEKFKIYKLYKSKGVE